jgi:hypothetical protein
MWAGGLRGSRFYTAARRTAKPRPVLRSADLCAGSPSDHAVRSRAASLPTGVQRDARFTASSRATQQPWKMFGKRTYCSWRSPTSRQLLGPHARGRRTEPRDDVHNLKDTIFVIGCRRPQRLENSVGSALRQATVLVSSENLQNLFLGDVRSQRSPNRDCKFVNHWRNPTIKIPTFSCTDDSWSEHDASPTGCSLSDLLLTEQR